jgi:hypothetical protein
MCMLLSVKLPQTIGMRLRYSPRVRKTICSFCSESWKNDDGTPLSSVSRELTNWYFEFPIYCCHECAGDGNLTYLIEIIGIIRHLENFHVWIHFDGHLIVNPSKYYVPVMGSSGNLQFICMNEKCSMIIRSGSTETGLFHESKIHCCVIDPQSGEIKFESVSIARIILGADLLNQILNREQQCSYIRSLGEFDSEYPDLTITNAIQQPAPESYIGPKIRDFSLANADSILRLFSLLVSGIYSNNTIKSFLNGEMKENFLKFITDSMISMTAFMKGNGFQCNFPELKEKPSVEDFLVKYYGRVGFSFTHCDIICQNFRNFLKLFRKILRDYCFIDDSQLSIDLFQYCRFLYATLHVSNQEFYHRFTRQVPYQKLNPYFEYLERYAMSKSPLCVEIFTMIPASQTELDICSVCLREDSANVIGKCLKHNICCSECFPRVSQNVKVCPTCRKKDFLP